MIHAKENDIISAPSADVKQKTPRTPRGCVQNIQVHPKADTYMVNDDKVTKPGAGVDILFKSLDQRKFDIWRILDS